MNQETNSSIYIQWNIIWPQKKEKRTYICCNVDEPWKYAKWKKPDEIGHIFPVGNEEEPDNKNKKHSEKKKRNQEKKQMEESISRKREWLLISMRFFWGWWKCSGIIKLYFYFIPHHEINFS